MGRKILQDIANTLSEMFVGWRMAEDLEKLSKLPDGVLTVNLLTPQASHSSEGSIDLHVVDELQLWAIQRLEREGIRFGDLDEVKLDIGIKTGRIATDRKNIISFDFECACRVVGSGRSYESKLSEAHHWHHRTNAKPRESGKGV